MMPLFCLWGVFLGLVNLGLKNKQPNWFFHYGDSLDDRATAQLTFRVWTLITFSTEKQVQDSQISLACGVSLQQKEEIGEKVVYGNNGNDITFKVLVAM